MSWFTDIVWIGNTLWPRWFVLAAGAFILLVITVVIAAAIEYPWIALTVVCAGIAIVIARYLLGWQ